MSSSASDVGRTITTGRIVLTFSLLAVLFAAAVWAKKANAAEQPGLRIAADNTEIRTSTIFAKDVYRVADADDNGVVQIRGDKLTIDFQGAPLKHVALRVGEVALGQLI